MPAEARCCRNQRQVRVIRFRCGPQARSPPAKGPVPRSADRARQPRSTLPAADLLGGGVECLHDVGGDPPAGGAVMAVAAGPLADRRALLTIDGTPPAASGGGTSAPAAADPAARVDPLLQVVAKLRCILGRKIDFIADAVKPEFDSLVR